MENKTLSMPTEHNDTVILQLDRPRTLRLGHKALKRFSATTGTPLSELEATVQRYDKLSTLVYIALSEEDPSLTPDQVDDMLDAIPIREVIAAASKAVEAAFADDSPGEAPSDPLPAAGIGDKA